MAAMAAGCPTSLRDKAAAISLASKSVDRNLDRDEIWLMNESVKTRMNQGLCVFIMEGGGAKARPGGCWEDGRAGGFLIRNEGLTRSGARSAIAPEGE